MVFVFEGGSSRGDEIVRVDRCRQDKGGEVEGRRWVGTAHREPWT